MSSCAANDMNQYTQIDTNGSDFTPEYDADGNQTLIQTETGIWRVTYNVQNRAVRFENESDGTVITCDYDYMGRRVFKKVEKNGVVTVHERYLYRDYLQIASLDMMEGQNQALINAYVWDPTQPVATRPLAIFYKGVAYYYGWDLTKNITEIFSLSARLQIDYVYTPFGQVRENGIIQQSIQWSSEYHDAETGLVYYNYRYYNPRDGRWTRREPIGEEMGNLYCYIDNDIIEDTDYLGLIIDTIWDVGNVLWDVGVIATGLVTGDEDMTKEGATDLALDTAAALIPGVVAGVSKIARAGKTSKRMKGKRGKPKKMSKRCQELRAAKQAAIAAAKRMACKGTVPKCPTVSMCETYRFRASLFQTERIARETYDRECFEGGDGGHITQRENKGRAEENCMQKYAQCMARAKK